MNYEVTIGNKNTVVVNPEQYDVEPTGKNEKVSANLYDYMVVDPTCYKSWVDSLPQVVRDAIDAAIKNVMNIFTDLLNQIKNEIEGNNNSLLNSLKNEILKIMFDADTETRNLINQFRTQLTGDINSQRNYIDQIEAYILNELNNRTGILETRISEKTDQFAVSQIVQAAVATMNNNIAMSYETKTAVADKIGNVKANAIMMNTVTVNGKKIISGYSSLAAYEKGQAISDFTIFADKFQIVSTDQNNNLITQTPFRVENGIVWVGNVNTSEPPLKFIGNYSSPPTTGVEINNIYFNTIDGNQYIYKSIGWQLYALRGAKGDKGEDGKNGENGKDGSPGTRGSLTVTYNGTYSSGSATSSIFQSITSLTDKVLGDCVIFTSTSGETRYFRMASGSDNWQQVAMYVHGNMIVDGTIGADKLNVDAIIGKRIQMDSTYAASTQYFTDSIFGTQSSAFSFKNTNKTYGVACEKTNSGSGCAIYGLCSDSNQSGAAIVGVQQSSNADASAAYFYNKGFKAVIAATGNSSGQWGVFTDQKIYSGGGYSPFTGSHIVYSKEKIDVGDIVCTDDAWVVNVDQTCVWVSKSQTVKDKRVMGIVSYTKDTMLDNIKYNTLFSIKDENGEWSYKPEYKDFIEDMLNQGFKEVEINSLGEGAINVCGEGGDIEIGDYICTSSMAGKGMRQDDDLLHNYTVAKALEAVKFDSPTQVKMIACTYHCG